eukprot:CAMPEP_0184018582 /NCGR_PEP_ID=MMETSP0954-20121128/8230_1 /TAXON_ID=627963 /ORGANISM="Aplanochytrium sp, Strain PBS07" /LENGTH=69 /DNA_ID=CAMNT_0026300061 /DNA_START=981 /DNA_END=1190 /DNA_ORIENTATION=-
MIYMDVTQNYWSNEEKNETHFYVRTDTNLRARSFKVSLHGVGKVYTRENCLGAEDSEHFLQLDVNGNKS